MRWWRVCGKRLSATGHKQTPVAEESVTAAEKVDVLRRHHLHKELHRVATVEARSMVRVVFDIRWTKMVVPAEQQDFAVTIDCWDKHGMDCYYISRRDHCRPGHGDLLEPKNELAIEEAPEE
jgi:hypothetical protein